MTSSLTQWSALVGTFLPLLIAVIQRQKWSTQLRTAVGVAACAVAAVVTAYVEGKLNLHSFSTSALTIFLMTKTTYLAVWKPTGIADNVEQRTTFSKGYTS